MYAPLYAYMAGPEGMYSEGSHRTRWFRGRAAPKPVGREWRGFGICRSTWELPMRFQRTDRFDKELQQISHSQCTLTLTSTRKSFTSYIAYVLNVCATLHCWVVSEVNMHLRISAADHRGATTHGGPEPVDSAPDTVSTTRSLAIPAYARR